MHSAGLRHVADVDDEGRCVGVLGDRVVTGAWALNPMSLDTVHIAAVVEPQVAVLGSSATVADVARAMHQHGTDAIVIVDDDSAPVGMITAGDLVALLAKPTR